MTGKMDELRVGDQVFRYDRDLTRQAYVSIRTGGAEECGCSYCGNFAAQRSLAYPAGFLSLLDQLGIDANKEGEVYELGLVEGLRLYGGWLFFAGELIEAGERLSPDAGTEFEFHITDPKRLPKADVSFGDRVLAVDFTTRIPWILEEEP